MRWVGLACLACAACAGEHSVLQALVSEPLTDVALLTSSPWLPVVRGELRRGCPSSCGHGVLLSTFPYGR